METAPRAPRLLPEFNSGCLRSSSGAALGALYDELNAPLAPGRFDTLAPAEVAGIKHGTVNSVTGWLVGADGLRAWQRSAAPDFQACSWAASR
jgi:hypothetical protein